MIKIKRVVMRNFLSVGNAPQEVALDADSITLVLGENVDRGGNNNRNGVGKSTILQGICFGLFGEPLSNIKKDNLVNSYNGKNMEVTVEYSIGGREYKIKRGRKPAFIHYYVDDGLVSTPESDESQGDSKFTQEEISKTLGISHDLFRHIVLMSTYTDPFLKMKPGEQRILIEELLGISQISRRSEILKEQIKSTKEAIKSEEYRIAAITESNRKIRSAIHELQSKHDSWSVGRDQRIADLKAGIDALSQVDISEEIATHRKKQDAKELNVALAAANKDLRNLDLQLSGKKMTEQRLINQLRATVDHKCHACGQEVHDDSHTKLLEEITAQITSLEAEISEINETITQSRLVVEEITHGLQTLGPIGDTTYPSLEDALAHKNSIDALCSELTREEQSLNPYADQIESLSENGIQEISQDEINDLGLVFKHQDFLLKLLTSKDSFIRKKIIEHNISHLNQRLNFYLDKLGLPHEVVFKSDLSVEISLLGRDFDFEQLSRGEMGRVILATGWAFRDVWESLNQGMNLMVVDELIDNGLDYQGVENALDLMKKMARERQKSVFLISHKEELIGRVTTTLKVKKENNFTRFEVEGAGDQ